MVTIGSHCFFSDMRLSDTFGVNLRRVRRERGLTQEDLAGVAQISREYVSRLENGGENVTITMIELLAKVLRVEAHVLLTRATKPDRHSR
jgi:transcriptional regulator with XRE-family HTH domain